MGARAFVALSRSKKELERRKAQILAFLFFCRITLETRLQGPQNPLWRGKARVLSKVYSCPYCMFLLLIHAACSCYMSVLNFWLQVHAAWAFCVSILHVHAAVYASCPCCMSLHVHASYAACPCMSILCVHAVCPCGKSVLHVHASCLLCISMFCICPCRMSILHIYVHAACPCITFMLHIHTACSYCVSMLNVHTVYTCCMSLLHGLAACPRCMSKLHVNAASPCCLSLVHVRATCTCFMSMLYFRIACTWQCYPCSISMLYVRASCLVHAACHVISYQSFPGSPVLSALTWQPRRAVLSWLSFPGILVQAISFCLSCSAFLVLPVLSACPVLPVLFCLSCSASPVLPVMFCPFCSPCRVLPVPFCLSSLPVPFCLSGSACPVCLSCSAFPVLPVLFCLSFLPVPFCLSCSAGPVLPVLFWLSCSAFPVLPVPFCLSYSSCPFLPFRFCLFNSITFYLQLSMIEKRLCTTSVPVRINYDENSKYNIQLKRSLKTIWKSQWKFLVRPRTYHAGKKRIEKISWKRPLKKFNCLRSLVPLLKECCFITTMYVHGCPMHTNFWFFILSIYSTYPLHHYITVALKWTIFNHWRLVPYWHNKDFCTTKNIKSYIISAKATGRHEYVQWPRTKGRCLSSKTTKILWSFVVFLYLSL